LALNKKQYVLLDNVLYHLVIDGTVRVIPPVKYRCDIIMEVHDGKFGGHL